MNNVIKQTNRTRHATPSTTRLASFDMDREELLMDRVYCSFNPQDVNYVTPEQHALLLEVVEFLTPKNVKRYFVDFYQHKKPCCGRTLYIYLTKVLNDPAMAHLTHYRHNGRNIHVLEISRQAMASERRRNNDVFGRSVLIQVRLSRTEWVPVKLCQIMLCYMIHEMHLFDHIEPFLDKIQRVMEEDEEQKMKKKYLKAKLAKKNMVTTSTLDFHMVDMDAWRVRLDKELSSTKSETRSGIDFYMS